ncbi:MAG: LysR family transcriptional regulator [Oscillospiraceae bacterium]
MFNSQLTAFVCAADSGSFSKAAETLYISSTAVMKQINALEKHLDLKLLERSSRGISLTPAGNVIYKYAKRMFDESETAICEARLVASEAETTFCVGTSILNPCKPFMDLWYQINEQFPGYKLHIVPFEDNHEGILGEIAALGTKFDFLVGACDSRQWLDRCNFLQLGTYRHCVAVPREHRLAQKPLLTVSDLYGETLMMVRKGDSPTVDRVRAEIEQHPRIRIEDTPQFYDMEVFNRCVQTRHVMMTLDCWTDVHPGLVTIPVDWPFTIPYGILYQLEPGADIQQFLALVKASHPAG